ncbi:uncharacterized protein LOC132556133 [Ylistrum balloti]|uniref:uncharacterized protein LOC132556133 n=1 Tax=Ylistrum balloti TaxID=509963 RepID=UPI002905AC6B|nr:uncharacterized protein LOC132556133 [Ylistrum balloti]XP_060076504.1 uncharacterized protein LOC132556133 [Ylistrum balloti]
MASIARDLFNIKSKSKDPIRKKLFGSPVVDGERTSEFHYTLTFMNKLQIEHDTELSYKALQKDTHEQCLTQMRQLLKKMAEDDWRYPNIDKLIGT